MKSVTIELKKKQIEAMQELSDELGYIAAKNNHKHLGVCLGQPDFYGSVKFVNFPPEVAELLCVISQHYKDGDTEFVHKMKKKAEKLEEKENEL